MTKDKLYEIFKMQIRKHPTYAAVAAMILTLILITGLNALLRSDDSKDAASPMYTVESGPLTISITESGTIRDKDEIILRNESGKTLKVASILDEGTMVKTGDIIVELDSTELEDDYQSRSIDVKNAEANLVAAGETLEITKNQAQANIDKASLTYKFAKLAEKKFINGIHPQSLEKADAAITLAEENLQRSEQDFAWSKQLHEKGFITKNELDADELSVKQRQITLRQAQLDRDILVKYTHPEDIETLKSNVEQGAMALERAERKAKADTVTSEAKLLAQESQFTTLKQRLNKLQEQIAACKIIAPTNGMIVYATSDSGSRHGGSSSRDRIEVGATVYPRHKIIRLSGKGSMTVDLSIQEASKPKVKKLMPTVVKIDAIPGQLFTGRISSISILPDSSQSWLNPDLKVYSCEVELDGANADITPGMRAQVEIVIEKHDNAMYIPLQCVLQVKGKPTVFVKTRSGFEKRTVQTGLDNSVMIHIISGLSAGENVMLAPPLDDAAKGNGNNGHQRRQKKKK